MVSDFNTVWANEISNHVSTQEYSTLTNIELIELLWNKFQHLFSGAVIYDPDIPDTINLASMIAGLENRLILGPDQIGLNGIPSVSDLYDLRSIAQQESWDNTADGQLKQYQWVYDNLWPDLDRRIIASISPGPPVSGELDGSLLFPLGLASRDYMIALNLPLLYLNPTHPRHKALLEQFFEDAESPIPVTGGVSLNEHGLMELASGFGNFLAVMNWPGEAIAGGNYSVLSGIRPQINKIDTQIDDQKILAALRDSPVATLFISDGDAMFLQSSMGFNDFFLWKDVQNQNFGWETNPMISELAPIIWNYFMDTAQEVSFISGISGGGYAGLHEMDNTERSNYL